MEVNHHEGGVSNIINVYDIVRSNNSGEIGLVTGVAREHEWYDDPNSTLPSPDHIEVLWNNNHLNEKKIVNHRNITLVGRGRLKPGLTVASDSSSGQTQTGVIIDVNNSCDLLTPDGSIIEGVDSRKLNPVKDFALGSLVVLGPWIGRVVGIVDNVTVLFDNGVISEFAKASESALEPIEKVLKIRGFFPNYPGYYPGQRVKAKLTSVFYKDIRFLSVMWKPESLNGTVIKVSIDYLRIDWRLCAAGRDVRDFPGKPNKWQCPKKLKLLPAFDHTRWVLFARCLYPNTGLSSNPESEWDFPQVLKIVNMKTQISVAWQDGTIGKGLDSNTLNKKRVTAPYIFPKQFVRMKFTTYVNNDVCEVQRTGIVKSVNSKEHTALVTWLKSDSQSEDSDLRESINEKEEVSIYELEIDPNRNYYYGYFVGFSKDQANADNLPRVGYIIGMENGVVEVTGVDGTISKVASEDIYGLVFRYDFHGHFRNKASPMLKKIKTFIFTLFLIFSRAVDVLGMVSMIYMWVRKHLNLFSLKFAREEIELLQCQRILCNSRFKGFDIAQDLSDHYFLGAVGQSNPTRKWLKKVQEDWSILQNNLPDGIVVRVYEDRMDLLRAMIVGPQGTPYQDGLFFFDFQLPPEYPDVPPVVHYHSGGWKINPNIYKEGRICLSLLDTWHGKGNEVWNSSSSTILQVLVSIQGLILNSKPYFNEAGYDKLVGTPEGEKDSLSYNEYAYLHNCKRMMQIMRHPLKDFEEIVKDHFVGRGNYILKACDAYMSGYLVGSLTNDASPSVDSKPNANTTGFKLMLANSIAPKLLFALNELGVDCHEFECLYNHSKCRSFLSTLFPY